MKRKTLLRRIKRFLKKWDDFDIDPLFPRSFIDPSHVCLLGCHEQIYACYEYHDPLGINEISRFLFFDQGGIETGSEREYLRLFDSYYHRELINMALEIFGLESIFLLPRGIAPLIISMKESNVFFYIAPRDRSESWGKIWKDVTKCKCPKIYKNRNYW